MNLLMRPFGLILLSWAFLFGPGASAGSSQVEPQVASSSDATQWKLLNGFHNNSEDNPVFRILDLAKKSIDIEIYEMSDPDIHFKLREAIKKTPNPIIVRIVKDPTPLGEKCHYFTPVSEEDSESCRNQKELVAEVAASPRGAFVPFNKEELCGDGGKKAHRASCFEHGKLIIIDGKHALVSTGNLNSSNLCNLRQNPRSCNRDFSYITSDTETVTALVTIFNSDMGGQAYDLASPSVSKKLTVSPYSLAPLVDFIKRAKATIRIENQYLKEKNINEALMEKAREGVKVYPMVSSLCAFGRPKPNASLAKIFQDFADSGVQVRFFPASMKISGKPGYLHAKAIVVDDRYAWVGSVNGSETATSKNREFGVFFDNSNEVKRLITILDADYRDANSETFQESMECAKDRGVSGEEE